MLLLIEISSSVINNKQDFSGFVCVFLTDYSILGSLMLNYLFISCYYEKCTLFEGLVKRQRLGNHKA